MLNLKGKSWEALWNGDDRKESGEKYGDDVCNILASELEMTEVGSYFQISNHWLLGGIYFDL